MNNFITICLSIGAIVLSIMVINNHSNQVEKAAESYEECVKVEYNGMTPSYYYEVNGEYPECKQKEQIS